MSLLRKQQIISPLDKFGRVRTSEPNNRLDNEFIYDKNPLTYDEVTVTGGTVTHNANPRDITLAIVNTTTATEASLYSHIDVPYTPGNSQLIDVTGVLDFANIGGGTAYVFLRTNVTGTVVETVEAQADWDNATTGVSWNYSHIFAFDFQSLKVGTIDYYMVQSGSFIKVHTINNDNLRNTGYWQRATLPQYWRIWNDADYTYMEMGYGDTENAIGFRYRITKNASATMKAICATVKSEGGGSIFDLPSLPFTANRGTTALAVSTTMIPVISIRVASTFNSLAYRGLVIPKGFSIEVDNPILFEWYYRPTLTGASWVSADTNSGVEYDISATAFTGGTKVESGYVSTGRNVTSGKEGLFSKLLLALGRTGTSDILSLVAIRTSSTNANTLASINWGEIR